ncbi:MAG: TolC family protein [Chromatiales bacterium]|jgi:outer membrane protein TolC
MSVTNLLVRTVLCCTLFATSARAEPLPQPLTLQQALQIGMQSHPALAEARADLEIASADADLVDADSGLTAKLQAELLAVDPSSASPDRSHDDSKYFFKLQKRLYDFGLSDAREAAAGKRVESRQWQYTDVRQQHQLNIMEHYFAVLLADLTYTVRDEEMTAAYLDYDKARDRHELGTVSDVRLLELESKYRELLQKRKLAEIEQRLSRARLANVLNRPGDLPADLLAPEVDWQQPFPEFQQVIEQVLEQNPYLQAARQNVQAARDGLAAAEKADRPVVNAQLVAAEYARETGSTHPLSAGFTIEMPLYQGGSTRAGIARARAQLEQSQALLSSAEMRVQQQVREVLTELDAYKSDLDTLQVTATYRELYLDQNRALYELEVASDLKDALIHTARVQLNRASSQFGFALAHAKLLALQGRLLDTPDTRIEETQAQ